MTTNFQVFKRYQDESDNWIVKLGSNDLTVTLTYEPSFKVRCGVSPVISGVFSKNSLDIRAMARVRYTRDSGMPKDACLEFESVDKAVCLTGTQIEELVKILSVMRDNIDGLNYVLQHVAELRDGDVF